MRVGCDDGDFIRIVEGEVGVDEDEKVGNCGGQGQSGGEEGPCVRVRVEDDGEVGGRRFYTAVRQRATLLSSRV